MALLVVIISLVLEWALGHRQRLRTLVWFRRYRRTLFDNVPKSWTDGLSGVLLIMLPLLLLMWLIQAQFGGAVFGLFDLAFGVLIVSYCLGPEPFNDRVDAYIVACENGQHERAQKLAEALVGEAVPESPHQQTHAVTQAILYEANVRIFAVVFWYLLLGPMGALLYRVAAFFVVDSRSLQAPQLQQASLRLQALLDWLPARLLSLSFFLVGSFDDAAKGWQKLLLQQPGLLEANRALVINTGCAAMRHEVDDITANCQDLQKYDLQWVRTSRALILRALVVWLAAIALLTLLGLFV